MGQAASKEAAKHAQRVARQSAKSSAPAASAAAGAASAQAPPPRPPPLGRPVADAPDVIEDPTEGLKQRQLKETEELLMRQPLPQQPAGGTGPTNARQPPQPDQNSGFYRGQIVDPRDVAQEQFLAHQSGLPATVTRQLVQQQQTPELAPDLLKFLQDVGPLEKKVNKEMTSPRILKELEEGDEEEKIQQLDAEANLRTRDDMRLVDNIDGFSTPRTTNFFATDVLEEEEEADFGLTDLEIYELLKRSAEAKDDTNAVCSAFHDEMLKKKKTGDSKDGESSVWTEAEQKEQQQLLKDTMKFLALPVVVKDDEMNYLGAHQRELEKEFSHHQKIDVVEETRVKLVLADLVDLGKKEIRRIRD